MKKYVASFLAGALFVLSATAFANDIKSLVGKKIQGEAVVELNGQALDNAIIVDGKSYAPVRVIGEAAGYEVSMQNKKIILDEKPSTTVTTPGKEQSVEDQKAKLEERISDAVLRISDTNKLIEASEYAIKNSPDSGEEEVLKVRKNQLAEQQTLLADLKAQLAALK